MSISGNAAYRLSCYMRKEGIDSSVLNINSGPDLKNVYLHRHKKQNVFISAINKINRTYKLRGKKADSYYYSPFPLLGHNIHKNRIVVEADIIYIHWIAGILCISELRNLLSLGKPVIFFMHDMWNFTGGCHHSFSCNQYQTGCKECNMFIDNNVPRKQIEILSSLLSNKKNVAFVSPSKWMANCARKSIVTKGCFVTNIANVVDVHIFKSMDRKKAKIDLGLPLDKKIITFGCQAGTQNKYKGWSYLRDSIRNLDRDDIHIVVYGSNDDEETRNQISLPMTFLGYIDDERKLATICNATDVFVSPSLAESFGLTFLENILCNTPVVGFDNTAIGEVIQHKKNGYLANNKDVVDLREGIIYLLDNKLPSHVTAYNPSQIINQHVQLMETLLSNRR